MSKITITLLGSCGGVAQAILSIFNQSMLDKSDPIHSFIKSSKFHLVDMKQKKESYYYSSYPNLAGKLSFHQFNLDDTKTFKKHLQQTNTTHVIDLSWADTLEMISVCNELGINYINSALENTEVDNDEELEGFTLIERFLIFEENRNKYKNLKAVVCSGMNPGVVQWMFLEMLKKNNNELPKACYIVEEDNSFYKDKSKAKKDTVYVTWSPECYLDEAILNFPMFTKGDTPLFLYEDVYNLDFKVSLGDKKFYGCLMPHEEVLTLGKLFNMELGFIYKVNDHTTNLIRENLEDVDVLWDRDMTVLDPKEAELIGEDLVGVLLVYDDKEFFMYNKMDNKTVFANYGVNATYFQVACGVYAGFSSLLLDYFPKDIYYVEELLLNTNSQYGKYLSHYMKNFVTGKNSFTDGLLLDRQKHFN